MNGLMLFRDTKEAVYALERFFTFAPTILAILTLVVVKCVGDDFSINPTREVVFTAAD